MKFFTVENIGKTRSKTPEGFLLCLNVPIGRTGELIYGEGEVPIEAKHGIVKIQRNDDQVFKQETIASFEGKPVTIDHPDKFVNPDNFSELVAGIVQNVRRGTGVEDNLLIADLLIQTSAGIKAINDGVVEVSCGYDADYEQLAAGLGVQHNIVGNHVALVAKGRCGSRCAIGDKETFMSKVKKVSWADRMRKAFMSKDAEAAEALAKEVEDAEPDDDETKDGEPDDKDGKTADALAKLTKQIKSMDARMKAQDAEIAELKEKVGDADPDDEQKTEDDGDLTEAETAEKLDQKGVKINDSAWQDTVQRLAILSPDVRMPTRDSRMSVTDKAKAICSCQRKALDAALTADASIVRPFMAGHTTIDAMPDTAIQNAFIGASELARVKNNTAGARTSITTKDFGNAPISPADLNKSNRQYWADRQSKSST